MAIITCACAPDNDPKASTVNKPTQLSRKEQQLVAGYNSVFAK